MSLTHTAADWIAKASEPCHHRREPFGPCAVCLEDVMQEAMDGARGLLQSDLDDANERCRQQEYDADERQTEIENQRDAAVEATRKLIESVRDVRGAVANSTKEYIEQQLDAVADKAEVAT